MDSFAEMAIANERNGGAIDEFKNNTLGISLPKIPKIPNIINYSNLLAGTVSIPNSNLLEPYVFDSVKYAESINPELNKGLENSVFADGYKVPDVDSGGTALSSTSLSSNVDKYYNGEDLQTYGDYDYYIDKLGKTRDFATGEGINLSGDNGLSSWFKDNQSMINAGLGVGGLVLGLANYGTMKDWYGKQGQLIDQQIANNAWNIQNKKDIQSEFKTV
jgi:hypothetical protein